MWDLALRYYKDNFQWRKIAEANPPPGVHDPHWIYPGQVLVLPDIGEPVQAEPAPATASTWPQQSLAQEDQAMDPEPPVPAQEAILPPVAAPPEPPPEYKPDEADGTVTLPEMLSSQLPDGLVGLPPSTYRVKALTGWKRDGEVVGLEGKDLIAAEGDSVHARIDAAGVAVGQRYIVFRNAAPSESDTDKAAVYLAKIGVLEVRRLVKGSVYLALVLRSNETVQVGDMIKREVPSGKAR